MFASSGGSTVIPERLTAAVRRPEPAKISMNKTFFPIGSFFAGEVWRGARLALQGPISRRTRAPPHLGSGAHGALGPLAPFALPLPLFLASLPLPLALPFTCCLCLLESCLGFPVRLGLYGSCCLDMGPAGRFPSTTFDTLRTRVGRLPSLARNQSHLR